MSIFNHLTLKTAVSNTKLTRNNLVSTYTVFKTFENSKLSNNLSSDVSYNFTFISLISPNLLNNIRIDDINLVSSTRSKKSSILVKKSYLIMTWLYYLSFTVTNKAEENPIKFTFLPTLRRKYTLTKAPMAHKTNSKEQFVFKFYKCRVSIKTQLVQEFSLNSVDQLLLALLNAKNYFPFFSTNLLFLKFYSIRMTLTDSNYFNFYKFVSSSKKLK